MDWFEKITDFAETSYSVAATQVIVHEAGKPDELAVLPQDHYVRSSVRYLADSAFALSMRSARSA